MTDTTTAPEADKTPEKASTSTVEATEPAPGTPEPDATTGPQEDAESRSPNAEAAKYRTQLRATETERDTLREQVRDMQAAVVEMMVEPRLKNVADFDLHVDLASLIADDGKLDRAKITAAIDELLTDRPYLAADVKRRPVERAKPREGTPVRDGVPAHVRTLAEKFGGRDDVKWGSVLNKQGEHAPAASSGQRSVASEMHQE